MHQRMEPVVSDELPLGAHLVTPRRGYVHHGIYAGNGRVIQYGGFNRLLERRPVEETSLDRFTRGRGYAVKARVAPRFDAAEAVARARSRLGEDRYRLWSNNCEHFVEWCISGSSRSHQVEAIAKALTIARGAAPKTWRSTCAICAAKSIPAVSPPPTPCRRARNRYRVGRRACTRRRGP